ncbi:pyocin knob domain-containing S74 family peptidase [Chitinophaga sp.]
MPGLAVRVFNGTQNLLHSTFHADGTFSKTGTVGTIGLSSDGMEISFNRNNANYIRAITPGGYFNFITGGSIRNDTASALTLYANKAAIFRGSVKMDSLVARVAPAATFLAIDNGIISRRDAADVLSDIAGVGRIPLTTNPTNIGAFTGNLNTITNSGIFHIGVAENRPSVQPGYLVSGGNAGLATTYKFQLFGAYNTENELFFRQGISGGNWGPWHKVASEGWVNTRLTADSLKVIRNGTTAQTANFNITGIGEIGTIFTQTIMSNNSIKGLTLIGGATGPNSGRGGQITLFGGAHPTNPGQITFHSGDVMDASQQPERMRITKEGNVGIGTSAPDEKFQVTGNVKISQQVMAPIFASNNSAGTISLLGGQIGGNHGGQIGLYGGTHTSSPGEIILFTGIGSGYQAERMRVTKEGNVGIGTSTPTSLLHVNGNVTATAFYQSSLRKLKKDIHPFKGNALAVLQSAQVRSFLFKADTTRHISIGFIADEVPEEFATPGRTGVDQANLAGLLVKALQELKTEKDAMETELKAKNEALEARLNAIEAQLAKEK